MNGPFSQRDSCIGPPEALQKKQKPLDPPGATPLDQANEQHPLFQGLVAVHGHVSKCADLVAEIPPHGLGNFYGQDMLFAA
jgi:hypothetical protein